MAPSYSVAERLLRGVSLGLGWGGVSVGSGLGFRKERQREGAEEDGGPIAGGEAGPGKGGCGGCVDPWGR